MNQLAFSFPSPFFSLIQFQSIPIWAAAEHALLEKNCKFSFFYNFERYEIVMNYENFSQF
jgi:hypothetical protein